jgi:hypothetical protein
VGNATDTSVTWSVSESGGGSVSASGLYTAPSTAGTYHVVAKSNADQTKTATATLTVNAGSATDPIPTAVGTGSRHNPQSITTVTGAGPMPSTTGAPVAACAGNGTTDDTTCLQNAINAAASAGKPLLIPTTSSYYRITNRLTVTTSLIGTGGMPTIKTANTNTNYLGDVLMLPKTFTGWIYNLHLVGTFSGTGSSAGEWAHTIDLGCVSNVSIVGNLLEKASGDGIGTDQCHTEVSGTATNVLIENNTIKDTWRCSVALIWNSNYWVIRDNVFDKQVNYVSGIDFELEGTSTANSVEVLYNKFVMNNTVPYSASRGADGKAVSAWQVTGNSAPGGNIYVHHNYGTFGTGFWMWGGSGWGYVTQFSNVAGSSPAP